MAGKSKKHAGAKKDVAKSIGRPRDLSKRAAILQAAKEHFMRHGFDRASMDAIAASAAVSKLTVYSHFGSKDELFKAMITDKCKECRINDDYERLVALPIKEALIHIATRFVDLMFQQDVIDLNRIVLTESADKPKISQLLYEAGPRPSKAAFAAFLEHAHKTRKLTIDSIERATQHFFILLKGERHFTVMMNLQPLPSIREKKAHIEDCVEVFMRAYAPKSKALKVASKKSDPSTKRAGKR